MPVQILGREAKLDNEIAGQVFRFGLAVLLPPEPEEGVLVITHDGPGVRAADEIAALEADLPLFPEPRRFAEHVAPR